MSNIHERAYKLAYGEGLNKQAIFNTLKIKSQMKAFAKQLSSDLKQQGGKLDKTYSLGNTAKELMKALYEKPSYDNKHKDWHQELVDFLAKQLNLNPSKFQLLVEQGGVKVKVANNFSNNKISNCAKFCAGCGCSLSSKREAFSKQAREDWSLYNKLGDIQSNFSELLAKIKSGYAHVEGIRTVLTNLNKAEDALTDALFDLGEILSD